MICPFAGRKLAGSIDSASMDSGEATVSERHLEPGPGRRPLDRLRPPGHRRLDLGQGHFVFLEAVGNPDLGWDPDSFEVAEEDLAAARLLLPLRELWAFLELDSRAVACLAVRNLQAGLAVESFGHDAAHRPHG